MARTKLKGVEGEFLRLVSQSDLRVGEVAAELGLDEEQAVDLVSKLRSQGKIRLEEPRPYFSLLSYAFSPYSGWFWAAASACVLALILLAATSGAAVYLRYVFGSVFVLFLPGYSLVELLYAKKGELDSLERLALSIGLSLALVPLDGLVLNYTPWGIRLVPIAASLGFLTLTFLVFALRRKHSYYLLLRDAEPSPEQRSG